MFAQTRHNSAILLELKIPVFCHVQLQSSVCQFSFRQDSLSSRYPRTDRPDHFCQSSHTNSFTCPNAKSTRSFYDLVGFFSGCIAPHPGASLLEGYTEQIAVQNASQHERFEEGGRWRSAVCIDGEWHVEIKARSKDMIRHI